MTYDGRFMCVCSAEGLEECRAVLAEVQEMFRREPREDIISDDGHNLTQAYSDAGLITNAVYWADSKQELRYEWTFASDQWCGVGCIEYTYDEKTKEWADAPSDHVYFQCDVVEHGIAACIKYYEDKHRAAE